MFMQRNIPSSIKYLREGKNQTIIVSKESPPVEPAALPACIKNRPQGRQDCKHVFCSWTLIG
jgi:hypothetical protein